MHVFAPFSWNHLLTAIRAIRYLSIKIAKIIEFTVHGGITARKLFNCYVLRLVIGEAKLAVGAHESVFGFLQMIYRFINFINGRLKRA